MKRILVSALAAVLFHGAVLFFLPFSDFVPGTVSPEDHGIAIQITHLPPEPEKKTGPAPASDMPPVPRPEKKKTSEKKQLHEEQQPLEPLPDIETPALLPIETEARPDPFEIVPKKELMHKKEDLTLSPPPRRTTPDQNLSETREAKPTAADMAASTDKTPVAGNPDDLNSPAPDPPPRRKEAVPLYKKNPPPRYPGNARRRGHAGTVLLMVYVTEKGEAGQVRIFESSGHASLDRAAEKAVADWRFEPGTSDGVPTGMWVKIPILFELKP